MKVLHHRAKVCVRSYLNGELRSEGIISRNIYEYRGKPHILSMNNPYPVELGPAGVWIFNSHCQSVPFLTGAEFLARLKNL